MYLEPPQKSKFMSGDDCRNPLYFPTMNNILPVLFDVYVPWNLSNVTYPYLTDTQPTHKGMRSVSNILKV